MFLIISEIYLFLFRTHVKLLDATTLSISEVAEQSGFKHSRNFSTVFKNAMGMSPSDYRKKDSRPS